MERRRQELQLSVKVCFRIIRYRVFAGEPGRTEHAPSDDERDEGQSETQLRAVSTHGKQPERLDIPPAWWAACTDADRPSLLSPTPSNETLKFILLKQPIT